MNGEHEGQPFYETLAGVLTGHIEDMASAEPSFGHAQALLNHGRVYRPCLQNPKWLSVGHSGICFKNATVYALERGDVVYTEGYAIDPSFPVPVQHAWLVDTDDKVIDPTWTDNKGHVYFGMAFRRSFVAEMLSYHRNEPGILVNMHLIRRRLRSPAAIENEIVRGQAATADTPPLS